MARKSRIAIVGLCLLGLSLVCFSSQANAQSVATCTDICSQFPLDAAHVTCLGEALEELGYPVDATPACALVTTQDQCLACYAAISAADVHCVIAHQVCALLRGASTATPTPPAVGAPMVSAGGLICEPDEDECICPGGQICTYNCPGGDCELDCAGGASCTLNCPGGDCELDCAGGARCTLNCPGGGCEQDCASGASCTLNCPGGNCELDCVAGATCSMNCPADMPCECDGPGCP